MTETKDKFVLMDVHENNFGELRARKEFHHIEDLRAVGRLYEPLAIEMALQLQDAETDVFWKAAKLTVYHHEHARGIVMHIESMVDIVLQLNTTETMELVRQIRKPSRIANLPVPKFLVEGPAGCPAAARPFAEVGFQITPTFCTMRVDAFRNLGPFVFQLYRHLGDRLADRLHHAATLVAKNTVRREVQSL